ncbi:hypothetical protein EV426DRAFT_722188 [Tirmania nivea]|nr:hypothetical protein EV426DRAFT_722188 [Tirmania nivea]
MVKDLKWILEQDDLLPNLSFDEHKYYPKQHLNGKPPPLITITTTTKKISKGRTSKGESYQTGKKAKDKCDGEILDLLDNPTPEKYAKLEPKVVEDLTVANKIRDLLYEWEGMDEDSYEILPDARIIRCLNMVLNGECLTVRSVPRNVMPPPALTKTNTISLEEHEEEENDDDKEQEDEEENNEEED